MIEKRNSGAKRYNHLYQTQHLNHKNKYAIVLGASSTPDYKEVNFYVTSGNSVTPSETQWFPLKWSFSNSIQPQPPKQQLLLVFQGIKF